MEVEAKKLKLTTREPLLTEVSQCHKNCGGMACMVSGMVR